MAILLKRRYDLIVLRVRMLLDGELAHVKCSLETSHVGIIETGTEMRFSLEEFDVPSRLSLRMERGQGARPRVPERLLEAVGEFVSEHGRERPLWIHLMSPYGNLALVPWERELAGLGVAVLRLPEFVVQPPLEYPQTLTVALCGSAPRAKTPFEVSDYLQSLAEMYLEYAGRDVTVHIFTDAEQYDWLDNPNKDKRVVIHDPQESQSWERDDKMLRQPGQRLGNAWLRWMRDKLSGIGVDTVHFVCHGYMGTSRGALALAESPRENADERWSRFVGAAELNAFLTSAGAWSVAFTSPINNYSPFGLRMLWDELGQMRPGALLLHDPGGHAAPHIPLDRQWANMPDVLAFLYANRPVAPPVGADYTLFCQPYLVPAVDRKEGDSVEGDSQAAWREYTARLAESSPKGGSAVPSRLGIMETGIAEVGGSLMDADGAGWLAAAQRFMEQQHWQLLSESRIAQQQGPDSIASKHVDAGLEAMQKIQHVLKDYSGRFEVI